MFQGARTRDMLMPLQDYETSRFSLVGLVWWFFQMHYPIPPSGQRHNGMPPSGMLARGRMMVSFSHSCMGPDLQGLQGLDLQYT